MTDQKWTDLKDIVEELGIDEAEIEIERSKIRRQQQFFRLRELRGATTLTQSDLAELVMLTQNRISKLEREDLDKLELRTIRKFVEGLGGTVRIQIDINGHLFSFDPEIEPPVSKVSLKSKYNYRK
jgi:DNA-binding XRE family transcriptional regulator